MRAGQIEQNMYFIQQGIARAYAEQQGQDVTFWFGQEGDPILSMRSYVEGLPAYEQIELLEESILYELPTSILEHLYHQDIEICNWGRKLAEKELISLERRLIHTQLQSGKQRYDALMKSSPSIIQRVPLKYISSYLGMTQVSLSRIRKEK